MNKFAEFIKKKLKSFDKELFSILEENNVSDEEIEKNSGILLRYISNEDEEYKVKFEISENKIEYDILPFSDEAIKNERILKISKNYIIHNFDDKNFLIDINDDLIKENGRKELFEKISEIITKMKNNEEVKGYFLWGDYGVGKTWLSIALLNKLSELGFTVVQTSWTDIFRTFKNIISTSDSSEELMDKINKADALFIDDLSGEKISDWSREEIMFPILNQRLQSNKLTLFTSNLSLSEYANTLFINNKKTNVEKIRVGRIIERIKSLTDEIKIEGPNHRITK